MVADFDGQRRRHDEEKGKRKGRATSAFNRGRPTCVEQLAAPSVTRISATVLDNSTYYPHNGGSGEA